MKASLTWPTRALGAGILMLLVMSSPSALAGIKHLGDHPPTCDVDRIWHKDHRWHGRVRLGNGNETSETVVGRWNVSDATIDRVRARAHMHQYTDRAVGVALGHGEVRPSLNRVTCFYAHDE